jgi:hypothetical protein
MSCDTADESGSKVISLELESVLAIWGCATASAAASKLTPASQPVLTCSKPETGVLLICIPVQIIPKLSATFNGEQLIKN